jgi:hypothetical protein
MGRRFATRYNAPWRCRWFPPLAYRGTDEYHNHAISFGLPLLGMVDIWRVRYPQIAGTEHIHSLINGRIEGDDVDGCDLCAETKADLLGELPP